VNALVFLLLAIAILAAGFVVFRRLRA